MKLSKTMKVFAVRRLWCCKEDIFFTTRIIRTGLWKQKLLFTMTIPKNTPYDREVKSSETIERRFTFGGTNCWVLIPVYMGDK